MKIKVNKKKKFFRPRKRVFFFCLKCELFVLNRQYTVGKYVIGHEYYLYILFHIRRENFVLY